MCMDCGSTAGRPPGCADGCRSNSAAPTCAFPYPSVTADLAANARALGAFLARLRADTLHLVGHSMGGLVILEFFESVLGRGIATSRRPLPPGRIVLLGLPGARQPRRRSAWHSWPFGRSNHGTRPRQKCCSSRARVNGAARATSASSQAIGRSGLGHLLGRNRCAERRDGTGGGDAPGGRPRTPARCA